MVDAIFFLDLCEAAQVEAIKFKSGYSLGFFFYFAFCFYTSTYLFTCSNLHTTQYLQLD